MYKVALIVLGIFVISGTAIPYCRSPYWWIRGFDFPRFQFVTVGILVLLLYLPFAMMAWGDGLFLAGLISAIVLQLRRVLPFGKFWRPQVLVTEDDHSDAEAKTSLSLMVANVLMTNRRAGDLVKIVKREDPDMLLTLETDLWWQDQLEPLEQTYRYTVKCPQDNLYGIHLYSKLPLVDPECQFIIEKDVPSIHSRVKLPCGELFNFHGLHPAPPSPSENLKSQERDGELLIVGKRIAGHGGPTVVTGDLNDVAWSDTTLLFRKISRLLDPRIGRGMFNSFHAKFWFLRWPLDHFFHSDDFALIRMKRLPRIGSDHFPIFIKLRYAPKASCFQNQNPADTEEEKLADQKIEQARERGNAN